MGPAVSLPLTCCRSRRPMPAAVDRSPVRTTSSRCRPFLRHSSETPFTSQRSVTASCAATTEGRRGAAPFAACRSWRRKGSASTASGRSTSPHSAAGHGCCSPRRGSSGGGEAEVGERLRNLWKAQLRVGGEAYLHAEERGDDPEADDHSFGAGHAHVGRERASTSLHLFEPQRHKRCPARIAHGCSCLFFPFTEGTFSILSKCCSRASTCFDQKRRKGTSHASSSMSGSGLSR